MPLVLEGAKLGVIENQLIASDLTNANSSGARINGLALIDCRVKGLKIGVAGLENMVFAFSHDGHSIILINQSVRGGSGWSMSTCWGNKLGG